MQFFQYRVAGLAVCLALAGCGQLAGNTQPTAEALSSAPLPPGMSTVKMVAGTTGEPYNWNQLLEDIDAADIIIFGEVHTDADGHVIQTEVITAAVQYWGGLTLSLEEFDRSQQVDLDAYARGEMTPVELKATRSFVMPAVRDNWMTWNLPKLEAARQADAPMLASNAPLKYSRMVRNKGCDNLPELTAEQRALFECPVAPVDPAYKARFVRNIRSVIGANKIVGMKPLQDEQTDRMFRAQRVWDATMAASIAQARAEGADKVLHIVGNQHSDFDGGLIQELRARDADSRILVISFRPKRSARLLNSDRRRADIVIYTR